jgi:hypothetical protein
VLRKGESVTAEAIAYMTYERDAELTWETSGQRYREFYETMEAAAAELV